jgi:hypothetical protein
LSSTFCRQKNQHPQRTLQSQSQSQSHCRAVPCLSGRKAQPTKAAIAKAANKSAAMNASPVTTKTNKPQVTPDSSGLEQRMSVEKGVVDELLLVCGVIGTTAKDGEELVPVTDCLNWLQDLQRALRRDDDTYRPISLLIGKWKVVRQKLLPLVMTCRYDTPMVLTIVKILVILTKPLSDTTKRAGRMVINTQNKKKYSEEYVVGFAIIALIRYSTSPQPARSDFHVFPCLPPDSSRSRSNSAKMLSLKPRCS